MHISTSFSGCQELANRNMPTFVARYDAVDRKSYRLAIDRWEAEGGSIPGGDYELRGVAVGGRRISRIAPSAKPATPSSMTAR
jgi:hypothetical protein